MEIERQVKGAPEVVAQGEAETPSTAVEVGPVPQHGWVEALLRHGYQLRMINELRRGFGGQIDRALLPLAYWLMQEAAAPRAVTAGLAREALAEAGLYDQGIGPRLSLRSLGRALGLPRETTRRSALDLVDQGWMRPFAPERVPQPTQRLLAWLGYALGPTFLGDMLWTAGRIDDLRHRRAIGGGIAAIERAIRACRTDQLPARLLPEPALPAPASPQALGCAIVLAGYHLRHAVAVRGAFGGDLMQALVLGEIGHYCFGPIVALRPARSWAELDAHLGSPEFIAQARADGRLRSCTTHSLALSMGLAPETMRRKLATLVGRGWIERDEEGCWWPARGLLEAFEDFNAARTQDFERSVQRILAILGPAPAPTRAA